MPNIQTLARVAAANADTDGAVLALCMEAAQRWLENAGAARRTDDELYDWAVYMLATHYYDNRGVMADGSAAEIPMGVMTIMHQLRLENPEPVTDGGGTAGSPEGA